MKAGKNGLGVPILGVLASCLSCSGGLDLSEIEGTYDLSKYSGGVPVACPLDIKDLRASASCEDGKGWSLEIDANADEDIIEGFIDIENLGNCDHTGIYLDFKATKKEDRDTEGKLSVLAGRWEITAKETATTGGISINPLCAAEKSSNQSWTGEANILGDSATLNFESEHEDHIDRECYTLRVKGEDEIEVERCY